MTWIEVTDGVYQQRYEPLDVSVCLIRGDGGLLLVDTRSNAREAAEIADDARVLGAGEIRWVVNTHAHYDHTFGNQYFAPTAPIYGHHLIPSHFERYEAPRLTAWQQDPSAAPQYDWKGVVITPPSHLVHDRQSLDIGGRIVELIPLPQGHTNTDLVVHVPDANAWLVGDVIEQSGPPMFGSGSFPLDWPAALDLLGDLIQETDAVVPGHGSVVDRSFVRAQAGVLHVIADGIRSAHAVVEPIESVGERLASITSMPLEFIEVAVLRGYSQLAAERA